MSTDDRNSLGGKPLMRMLKRVIRNDGKITLQIPEVMDVLCRELSIEVNVLDQAEINTCVDIAFAAFKRWPGWPKLTGKVYELKTINDESLFSQILEARYANLKEFVQHELDSTDVYELARNVSSQEMNQSKPLKRKVYHQYESICKKQSVSQSSRLDNVIPITSISTANALRSSKSGYKITLPDGLPFSAYIPTELLMLNIKELSLSTIMNWWCFSLHVNLSALTMKRETCHGQVQSIVSSVIEEDPPNMSEPLNHHKKLSVPPKHRRLVNKTFLCNLIKKIMCKSEESPYENIIKIIFHFITRDFMEAPPSITVPSLYVKKMLKQPYNRCLHKTKYKNRNFFDSDHFDMHMHQAVFPKYVLNILNVDDSPKKIALVNAEFFKNVFIKCKECRVKFDGVNMLRDLQKHFLFCHKHEGDWQCPHCLIWFPMTSLADERWYHRCSSVPGPDSPVKLKCRATLKK